MSNRRQASIAETRATSSEVLPAVLVHHDRDPIVQTPGTVVVEADRVLVRLGHSRNFAPDETVLLVAGPMGERRVVRATLEHCKNDTAELRVSEEWQPFDQRRWKRHACDIVAEVMSPSGLWNASAHIVDLSEGGLGMICDEAPPLPDIVVVTQGPSPRVLRCRVVSKRSLDGGRMFVNARFITKGAAGHSGVVKEVPWVEVKPHSGLAALRIPRRMAPRLLGHPVRRRIHFRKR